MEKARRMKLQPDVSGPVDWDGVSETGIAHRIAHIGRVIREARQDRRFTSEQLAARAGVSTGLLSQLERGRGNPSLVTLAKLAHALGLPMGSFFYGPHPAGRMVVRKSDRMTLEPRVGLRHELLTPDFNRRIEMLTARIPPGFSNEEEPFSHDGEEAIHILSGKLEVVVGGQHFLLDEGDTITHDSTIPHWWRNATKKPTDLIGSSTPPSF